MAEVAQPGAVCLLTYNEDDKNFYSVGHTADYTKEWRKEKEEKKITLVGFVQTKDMKNAEKKAKEMLVGGDLQLVKVDLNKEGMDWYQDDAKSSPENVLVKLVRAVEDFIEWVYILTRLKTDSIRHDIMHLKPKVVSEKVIDDCTTNIVFMDVFYKTIKKHYADKVFQASGWVYMMKCDVMKGIACYTIGCSALHPKTEELNKIRHEEGNNEIELVFSVYGMGRALDEFQRDLENAGCKKIQRQEGERKWYIEIEQA